MEKTEELIEMIKNQLSIFKSQGDKAEECVRESDNLLNELGWIDDNMRDLFLRRWAELILQEDQAMNLVAKCKKFVDKQKRSLLSNWERCSSTSPCSRAKSEAKRAAQAKFVDRLETMVDKAAKIWTEEDSDQ